MSEALAALDEVRNQLDELRPLPAELEERSRRWLLPRFLWASTALGRREHLSLVEVAVFLETERVGGSHPLDRFLDVLRHRASYQRIAAQADQGPQITLEFVRQLHQTLLTEPRVGGLDPELLVGQWKQHENPPTRRKGRTFEYAPPGEVEQRMTALMSDLAAMPPETHALRAAAWLYYRFHLVHPFEVENGRVARLLASTLLLHHGYPPLVIEPKLAGPYLDALAECDEQGDDTGPLEAFFAACLLETGRELLQIAKGEAPLSQELPERIRADQLESLSEILESPETSWRTRAGFEVRALHERATKIFNQLSVAGPLYSIALAQESLGPRHRLATTPGATKLPAADAGIVGELVLTIEGNPEASAGLKFPEPFRLQVLTAASQMGTHVVLHWGERDQARQEAGPPRAADWPELELDRLLTAEVESRRRRFEMQLLDLNLAPDSQGLIRRQLKLEPGEPPTGSGAFSRDVLARHQDLLGEEAADPGEPEAPSVPEPTTPRQQSTMRLRSPARSPDSGANRLLSEQFDVKPVLRASDPQTPQAGTARGPATPRKPTRRTRLIRGACGGCNNFVPPKESLTCPDCSAHYHEACLMKLGRCTSEECEETRAAKKGAKGSSKSDMVGGVQATEPPVEF